MVKRPAAWLCALALAWSALPGCQCSLCSLCKNGSNPPAASGYGATHSASPAMAQGWNTRTAPASAGVPVSTPVNASATPANVVRQASTSGGMTPNSNAPAMTPERRTVEKQPVTPAAYVPARAPEPPPIDLDARPEIDPPTPKEEPPVLRRPSTMRPAERLEPTPTPPQLEPPPPTSKVSTSPLEATDPDAVPPPSFPKLPPPPGDE
jgi:hypothetical protein